MDMAEKKSQMEERAQITAAEYVIELTRAVLEKRPPAAKPEEISMWQIYQMAKRHNMECITFSAAAQTAKKSDAKVMAEWEERSNMCAMQSVIQRAEIRKLSKALPEHGIRFMLLKGSILKDFYPRTEYRQMSDLDILIDKTNRAKLRPVMEGLGYVFDMSGCEDKVDIYKKLPWVNVEVHNVLEAFGEGKEKRYQNIWEHSTEKNGVYQMKWDDYYIFLMEHLAKHFYGPGCGIRFLLDIHIFRKEKEKELSEAYLEKEFQKRGMEKFRLRMEKIAEIWFGNGEWEEALQETEEIIFLAGTFGTLQRRCINEQAQIYEKYGTVWLVKPIYFFRRLFPGTGFMTAEYPFLKKMAFLLPFSWILRLGKGILFKRKEIGKELQSMRNSDKKDW